MPRNGDLNRTFFVLVRYIVKLSSLYSCYYELKASMFGSVMILLRYTLQ